MGRLFPPSLEEWHASVVGFGSGFAFGAAECDSGVARAFIRAALSFEGPSGHVAQANEEAAYTAACFVVGAAVGRAFDARND